MEPQNQASREPFGDETNSLGVGQPFESVGRRDFTIKASRRVAPDPPATQTTPPSLPTSRRPTHRYTSSTPNFAIPTPTYVRSQPLSRANSLSSPQSEHSPTASGGLIRRGSLSSASEAESGDERKGRRSASVPRLMAEAEEEKEERRRAQLQREMDSLPPHPRLWLPSHLSLYTTHSLSLHPLLAADITSFITASRLGGRTFLRLRESEMRELGMSVKWVEAMLDVQRGLRERAQFGGMWGFQGGQALSPPSEADAQKPTLQRRGSIDVEGSDLEEERGKEEWKRSWRALQGSKKVRGIARAFECEKVEEGSRVGTPAGSPVKRRPARVTIDAGDSPRRRQQGIFPQSPYPPFLGRGRSNSMSSTTSTASIDSGSGDEEDHFQTPSSISSRSLAQQLDHDMPKTPPTAYKSKITSHTLPYGLVRRPSQNRPHPEPTTDLSPSEEQRTVRNPSSDGTDGQQRKGLGELFGFQLPSSASALREESLDEVVELEVGARGGKKGSMVLVKRSQLAALSKRMAEVETQVALAQGGSSVAPSESEMGETELEELDMRLKSIESLLPLLPSSPTARSTRSSSQSSITALVQPRPHLSTWLHLAATSHAEATRLLEGPLMSWTALGGYCVMAGLGIGLVAGEVVVGRLFGLRRR